MSCSIWAHVTFDHAKNSALFEQSALACHASPVLEGSGESYGHQFPLKLGPTTFSWLIIARARTNVPMDLCTCTQITGFS